MAKSGVVICVVPLILERSPIVRLTLLLPAPPSGVERFGKNRGSVALAVPVRLTVALLRVIELSGSRWLVAPVRPTTNWAGPRVALPLLMNMPSGPSETDAFRPLAPAWAESLMPVSS